ncbi:hypothetical protein Q5H93_23720 [Hymenobacter sp. ASUV-10]|uniref:Uncharacterized protein n=1 Tax=Hymenobacter aranciens TaxID=3063996 RepID=A0ABT9BJ01_9BACT|nr:hypothetical protein [Hymenobacter sp. ASUV-10]MDO7877765.1 hypothetical protein [Hymenobacter sp. ASUV-10]
MATLTAALYLPRRHRRRLLLPPGLLALAGGVLVSCLGLLASPHVLRLQSVLQLKMPLLHPDDEWDFRAPSQLLSRYQLERFRPWHNSYFSSDPAANRREQLRLTTAVRNMVADTWHSGGVRVHFTPRARYEQLIFTLDLMNRENVKKYWIDHRKGNTTFYAITIAPNDYSRTPFYRRRHHPAYSE